MDYGKQTGDFRGEGVGEGDGLVVGSKEGTYFMVHWVLYATNESLSTTPKTIDVCTLAK